MQNNYERIEHLIVCCSKIRMLLNGFSCKVGIVKFRRELAVN